MEASWRMHGPVRLSTVHRRMRWTGDRTSVRMSCVRWDAQRVDVEDASTLPGMPSIRGLLRSVQVPEFPGLTFHEVRSRSALNQVPGESAMPFPWTINPYRGCSHSCVYCLAGNTDVLLADGRQRPVAELRV